ncbi:hypothetical protein HZ326_5816 [Fusarium oxysporum f. sp. albedinis]|nr:hypothetical protein HZ326_5816 [Fusarium oxysporum f. sp. albedinis]
MQDQPHGTRSAPLILELTESWRSRDDGSHPDSDLGNCPGRAGRRRTLIDSGGYLSVPRLGDKVDLSMCLAVRLPFTTDHL